MSAKVTFKRPSLEMEIEVGSLTELAGYITDQGLTLTKVFGSDIGIVVKSLTDTTTKEAVAAEGTPAADAGDAAPAADAAAPGKEKRKPGRPSTKDKAPEAPPPAPTPADAAPAPATTLTPSEQVKAAAATGDIPEFLRAPAAAVAPPPAPPAPPPPPPAAPAALPTGVLAGKIIAATDKYKEAGKEEMILNWLVGTGIVQAGATYDESVAVIRLLPDAKLGSVATALSVA